MLRRLAALATALFALAVIPATAASADTDEFSYSPGEYDLTVSVTTATVGVPFTVTVTGPAGNASFTLEVPGIDDSAIEVAGAQTAATSGGSAAFSVTLPEEGTYALTATDAEGQTVGTASVTAVAAEDGAAAPVGNDADATSTGSTLPATGAASMPYLLAAAVLVVLGIGALTVARLRTRSHRAATGDRSS